MILLIATISILPFCFLLLALTTFFFAAITWIRQWRRVSSTTTDSSNTSTCSLLSLNTALYCGRVSHTRFQPLIHSFSYPLFFCLLDLSEVDVLFNNERKGGSLLWPLNLFMTFRDEDHLKNSEGLLSDRSIFDENKRVNNDISTRIIQLISEKTNGKCKPSPEQKILLLTHLSYYGYCFNPVSFYYVLKDGKFNNDNEDNIEAIIAEVSNTPWNEMKCYVLHPDSTDMTIVKEGIQRKFQKKEDNKDDPKSSTCWSSINYVFDKKFHVSPFMEMDYIYDWTFWQMKKDEIVVSTTMIKKETKEEDGKDTSLKKSVKCFNAFFDIYRIPFHPFSLCYQLVKFPIYCMIIQVWIHIEALKLFVKGVEFIPHPEGTETRASAIIAMIMEPFFAFKDWMARKKEKRE